MAVKKSMLYLIIIFGAILLAVPAYWLVKGDSPEKINWVEGRILTDFNIKNRGLANGVKYLLRGDSLPFEDMMKREFVQGAFQADFESAVSDQFPFRLSLIQGAKTLERQLIRTAYLFSQDPAIPADMRSDYFVLRDGSAIFERPAVFRFATLEVIDKRIKNYQSLMEAYPDIHFNVYYIERIQNSRYHPMNDYFNNAEASQYYEYFLANYPEGLQVDGLTLTSFDDHLTYFYRSDHHWNIHGVLRAYQDIYEMLRQNYPDISDSRQYDEFIAFNEINFQGTSARKSFYPFHSEIFEVVDYALPPYRVVIGGNQTTYGHSTQYLAGQFSMAPYFNHYEGFFGGDAPLIEFIFDTPTDRNLLVLGNSYDNALIPLLASHYHHTYSVDLRYYQDFSFSAFLAEHPVNDVIVIGENSFAFTSNNYWIKP